MKLSYRYSFGCFVACCLLVLVGVWQKQRNFRATPEVKGEQFMNRSSIRGQEYHHNISIRGKWQQAQIDRFCDQYGQGNISYSLEIDQPLKNEFYRHLIVSDETKGLYCFMPKVGCTTARLILLVATGKISKTLIYLHKRKPILESKLEEGLKKSTFLAHSMNDQLRTDIIRTYNKYTIVRHPLQRILSAYIDKLSGPLLRINHPFNYFEHLKHEILKEMIPSTYSEWSQKDDMELRVEFTHFIDWIINQKLSSLNEHFAPQYHNAQPCRVRYHFYGNFDYFEQDLLNILRKFNIDGTVYLQMLSSLPKGNQTQQKLDLFWTQLSRELKLKVYKKFKIDFDFYHYLYPSEMVTTKRYLQVETPDFNNIY